MFALSLALAVLVAVLLFVVAWLVLRSMVTSRPMSPRRARAAIRDIEQQTVHSMLAAELSAQRATLEGKQHRPPDRP